MSSRNPDQYLDSEDISLLVEILKAAGHSEATAKDKSGGRLAAARFLTDAIQRGVLTKAQQTAARRKRGDAPCGQNQTPAETKTGAINRWENEGGAIARSPFEHSSKPDMACTPLHS
ncbi:hypothetical protein [Ensifer sp. SL37]|uniref:hypothetical protein n=1 Tax=Ensifer sp. SL37 TaxID=2995137 RepID=UPI002275526F|nr:hypothetical protein [Ensifer sp. SL37]MCY1745262.1 hypothetical protein [Ensifer sp. SL37]